MLPEERLSTYPIVAPFVGPDRFPYTERVDYELGPVAFEDTSQGMRYQIWRASLVGENVWLTSPNTPETLLFSKRCIQQISVSFDQNARYQLLYLLNNGELWLFWYDPVPQAFTHTFLETGVRDGHITVPDKRELLEPFSEVGVFYTKGDGLYYRSQLDRYLEPYLLQEGIAGRLMRVGMNSHYRLQAVFQMQPYQTYSCTLNLNCL